MYFWEDSDFKKRLDTARMVIKNRARGLRFGENRSRYFGHGIEVSHLKNYSEGEDVRFIDWNASFRLGRTFLKVFSETRENIIYILLDRSASMEFGAPETKSQTAVKVAYSLAHVALSGFNRVMLSEFSEGVVSTVSLGRSDINRKFAAVVDSAKAPGKTAIERSLRDFFANFRRRGVVFMISDLVDQPLSITDQISRLSLAHNFCLVHVNCAEDKGLPESGEFKFEDSETGETVEISMTPDIARRFASANTDFASGVSRRCLKYGGFYIPVACGSDPADVVRKIMLRSELGFSDNR